MQGSIRRPRIQVFWTDLANIPETFPPVQSDVETIIVNYTGFNGASDGQYLKKSGGGWAWDTPAPTVTTSEGDKDGPLVLEVSW